jgi:hypothetical protein
MKLKDLIDCAKALEAVFLTLFALLLWPLFFFLCIVCGESEFLKEILGEDDP